MKWIQYKLTTHPDAVEAISYHFSELGIEGIEIEDAIPLSEEDKRKMFVDIVDEPKIKDKDLAYVKFYLSELEDREGILLKVRNALNEIAEFLPIGEGKIEELVTDEKDWAENWKKFFKPFRVDDKIIIKPSWEMLDSVEEDDIVIEIDPGMAFGTGTHETTSLCIAMLNKYLKSGELVFDIGCGSGILGITASKLGAMRVICSDIDPNAVAVAKENVTMNQVGHNVEVLQGDLLETIEDKADLVVANILADVIILLTQNIKSVLKKGGLFISSGIILDKVNNVIAALEEQGFSIVEIQKKGEWAAIVAK